MGNNSKVNHSDPVVQRDGISARHALRRAKLLKAESFRKGACNNCGATDHNASSCLERPRKRGARWSEIFEEKLQNDHVNPTKNESGDLEADVIGINRRLRYCRFSESYAKKVLSSYALENPETQREYVATIRIQSLPSVPSPADGLVTHQRLVKERLKSQQSKKQLQYPNDNQYMYDEDGRILKMNLKPALVESTNVNQKDGWDFEVVTIIETYSSGELLSAVNRGGEFFIIRVYNSHSIANARKEIQDLQMPEHPNIYSLIDYVSDLEREKLYAVYSDTEFKMLSLRKMSIFMKLDFEKKLPFIKVALINALSALSQYHKSKKAHGNLNPDTILYDQRSRMFKLSHFMECNLGFPSYNAPEVLLGFREFSPLASDMWSIGCIFGELLRGRPIFEAENELHDIMRIFIGNRRDKWPSHPVCLPQSNFLEPEESLINLIPVLRGNPSALCLLMDLLRLAPGERISVEDARRHEFFHTEKDDRVEIFWQ